MIGGIDGYPSGIVILKYLTVIQTVTVTDTFAEKTVHLERAWNSGAPG